MKLRTIQLSVIGAIFMLFSATSMVEATENLEVIPINESKKIRMELNTPASSSVNVILYDRFERIVFSDQISKGATFAEEIDFSSMARGTYRLASKVGNLKYNRILKVGFDGIELKDSYYTTFPQFEQQDNRLIVHLLNNAENNIGVSIEDSSGAVLNDYYYEPGNTFTIAYRLDNLSPDTYTFKMMAGKEMYAFDFQVD